MRLLRHDLLSRILPLPAGLSYTPAMSARCRLDPQITLREVAMPYEERVGESKLNVLRDSADVSTLCGEWEGARAVVPCPIGFRREQLVN